MALTPEQIDLIANEYLVGVFQEMEQDVISDIARRVRKTGRITETAELMAQSMANQGFPPAEIRIQVMQALNADPKLQAEIAKHTLEYKKAVAERIDQLVKEAQEAGNELVANAGRMCFNDDLALWQEAGKELNNTALPQIIRATQAQTQDTMRNLTRTTSLALRDASGVEIPIMDGYKRFLDKTTLQVATGTFSYDEAVNRTIKEMAKSGIRFVEYNSANGRRTMTELDVATRRAVRTGVSQMAGKIMEENVKNSDTDLVITSQHMGSRPEHAEWQNKVFSLTGKDKRYKTLADGTGYGTVTGLKGANCTHNFYPYWPGFSIKEPDIKEPPPVKVNGREYTYYQATQKQREYERKLRAAKREIAIQEQSGGKPEDIAQLKREARALSKEYNSFSNAVGIRPKPNRARVVGVDRGDPPSPTNMPIRPKPPSGIGAEYTGRVRNGKVLYTDEEIISPFNSRMLDRHKDAFGDAEQIEQAIQDAYRKDFRSQLFLKDDPDSGVTEVSFEEYSKLSFSDKFYHYPSYEGYKEHLLLNQGNPHSPNIATEGSIMDGLYRYNLGATPGGYGKEKGARILFDEKYGISDFISNNPDMQYNGGTLYRGIKSTKADVKKLQSMVGTDETISMRGVSSWSTSEKVADDFTKHSLRGNANSAKVIFIEEGEFTREAMPFPYSSVGMMSQDEVIYSGHATFSVLSVEEKDGVYYARVRSKRTNP